MSKHLKEDYEIIDTYQHENEPGPSHQNENPPGSIFMDNVDPVLEPNMTLDDISEATRAEILLYPGTDQSKRRFFFKKHHMDYFRYYELFDCWNECFIKSKLNSLKFFVEFVEIFR